MYMITLSESHVRSLQWAADRGYFPQEFLDGIDESGPEQFEVPEHVAWALPQFQEEDPHAFLTCMPTEVCETILDFMDGII